MIELEARVHPGGIKARRPSGGARLVWPGRRWEPGRGGEEACALSTVELPACGADAGADADAGARLVHGDALAVAGALAREGLAGGVDLVYVDPPFASQAEYVHEARLDGPATGRVLRARAYDDRWDRVSGAYLDMLAPRLEALAGLLSPAGTIWVHVDWRASYLVRLLLDEILGPDAFVNEIVWRRAPNLGRQAASHQFGRTLDTIVVYGRERARLVPPTRLEPIEPSAVRRDEQGRPFTSAPRGDYTDESIARLDEEGRVHRTASGKVYVKYFLVKNAEGAWCRERRVDALWTDVPPLRHARVGERTGFPTQKPRALLDRIVACASPPGGLVVDLFAGSGTTGESAHALGRRFVLGDASPLSLATARARLLRAGAPVLVQRCERAAPAPGSSGGAPAAPGSSDGAPAAPGSSDGAPAPSGKAPRATVERRGGELRVVLCEPREPLAWAIDPAHHPSRPFRAAWHAERVPGARARPAPREAVVAAPPRARGGHIAVRVWYDDGGVGAALLEAP